MAFNTRWTSRKPSASYIIDHAAAWNTTDAMMSARAQSKQQLHNQGSRVILKLAVDPRKVAQNLEVKK